MLQETKVEGEALLNTSVNKWKYDSGKAVSARGTARGLGTLWTKSFSLERFSATQHWIFTELRHTVSNLTLALFNLYVPVHYEEKKECWRSLSDFLEQINPTNLVIGGDLNIILDPKEKKGGIQSRDPFSRTVGNLIQRWDLVDFKPVKGKFTWMNNRTGENHISARLDRFLINSSLMMDSRIVFTKILPKLTSDHKPILICLKKEEDLGPLPFRFSPLWAGKDGFIETVQEAWRMEVNGSPSFVWEQKLKNVKTALKAWIKNSMQSPNRQRKEAVTQLEGIQFDMEDTAPSITELAKEKSAQKNVYCSFRKEEEYWRLKSRSLWLKSGDKNTSYFHRQCRARLSRNHIAEITSSSGQVYKGFAQIQEAATHHFRNLLSAERNGEEEDEAEFLSVIPSLVSEEDNVSLMSPATEEEITNIVWSMDPDKAPGPDGFSIHFYRICWEIIKFDLFRMIRGVLKKAKMGGGTKSTFLALIPKETNPRSFDRYRPISLCNSSYKIVAKLLANRIKPLLQNLISPAQGGFVKGRKILDNVILIQEALHSSYARKEQGMIIKLDMSNAFDRVNRSFLFRVLEAFGFSQEFINIIKACIENVWIAPMVNGRPTEFFSASRGLRQGCPLSPFLYILMADSLSRKLTQEQHRGSIPGIRIVQGAPPVNHALFADDSLLLGGASLRMAKAFKSILQKYCSVTGALISERKSAVYGWNSDQQTIDRIASELGFKGYAEWDKIKYLGLPLTMGSNRNNLWEEVISKFNKKIAAWGGVWLSSGGKLTLIRSVLSALPTFQASLLLAPRQIADQISCLIRNFLWSGGKGNSNRFHLVNWELVKRPIKEGDLQIRDPLQANLALGCKILWQLISEPMHPISQILIHKYLRNRSIITFNPASSPKGTLAWRLCCGGIDFFRMHLYKVPGNGKKTWLWKDRIMGHPPLSEKNEIAELRVWLRSRRIRKIEDIVEWDDDGNWKCWNLPNIPEQLNEQLNLFSVEITDFAPVHKNEEDTWGWGQTGVYSAKQGYLQMQSKKDSVHPEGVWKQIWECFSIPKINFFFWTLFQNKILTGENLCKRNIAGPHRCVFCKKALETSAHIFLECEYAQKTWTSFLAGLNIRSPANCSITEMFLSWKARYPHSIAAKSLWSKVWIAAPKYVCWKLWLSRNETIFNQTETPAEKVAEKAKNLLLETLRQSNARDNTLRDEERAWLGDFIPIMSPPSVTRPLLKENWQIRDNAEGFQKWWKSQGKCTIFFDGASKGNPGRSGAGGIIYLPNGSKESFSWGLGIKTNNQAEVLSLLKACQLAKEKDPKEIAVFGDSELLIKALRKNKRFNDPILNKQILRVTRLLKEFPSVQIFHILRELNSEADSLANIGCNLEKSMISINSGESKMVLETEETQVACYEIEEPVRGLRQPSLALISQSNLFVYEIVLRQSKFDGMAIAFQIAYRVPQ
eukprot:PITA_18086